MPDADPETTPSADRRRRGTFDALDAAFEAGGLEAAVTELVGLPTGCRSAASP
jgi:hypothetical protein